MHESSLCFSLMDLLVSFLFNDVEEFFLSVADVLKKAYIPICIKKFFKKGCTNAQRIKFVVFLFLILFLSLG